MSIPGVAPKSWRHPLFSTTQKEPQTPRLKPPGGPVPFQNDQIEFLKENLPIIRKLLPSESQTSVRKPPIFKQDLNVPLMATGSDVLQQLGLTGKNIGVAVLDSGVASVPDLEDNLIATYRLKNGEVIMTLPGDSLGHGTAVAGLIAGSGKGPAGYRGMAPDAKIVSVQVANEHGGARYSDLPRAIHWLVKNKNNFKDKDGNPVPLKVINISMGFPEFLPTERDPLARAAREAWKAGIVVVAAAGNTGPAPMSLVAAPANEPSIIVTGAIDDRGTPDRSKAIMAPFSSRGPTPEGEKLPTFVAPGTDVISLNVAGSMLDKTARAADALRDMKDDDLYKLLQQDDELREGLEISEEEMAFSSPREIREEVHQHLPAVRLVNDYLIALSGTSFASPIAAGGVGQVLQWMVEQGKSGDPDSVKEVLERTSEKLPGVSEDAQGAGYVNFRKAYDFLQANP